MESREVVVALLLMRMNNSYANSYALCRILSRAFGIINCSEIIKTLIKEEYILTDNEAVESFVVTEKGVAISTLNKEQVVTTLRQDKYCQKDFSKFMIDHL